MDPAWSPDGTRIAFTRGEADSYIGEIWVMNADGTGQSRLTPPFDIGVNAAWSPDGTQIVFRHRYGISVMNANGTASHELTESGEAGVDPDVVDSQPAWSPGGSTILFRRLDMFSVHEFIWAITPDGTQGGRVTDDITYSEGTSHDTAPNWAPAGPRFAVWRYAEPEFEAAGPVGLVIATEADPEGYTLFQNGDYGVFANGDLPAWSPDGTKIAFGEGNIYVMPVSGGTPLNLTPSSGFNRDADWQPIPINTHVRPKSANWTRVSLVPAFAACTAPNRTHGPPLAFGSCAPPQQASSQLTVGTPDANGAPVNSTGYVSFGAVPGNANTPADEADVQLRAVIKDVRDAGTLTDHTGTLSVRAALRVTDRDNTPHPGGPGAATVSDGSLAFDVPCAATPDTTVGSTCSVQTSADAVIAGLVKERLRSVWELGRVEVRDGASNPFMTQGVLVP
jgi:hypothetical protein